MKMKIVNDRRIFYVDIPQEKAEEFLDRIKFEFEKNKREVFVKKFVPFYKSKGWCPELAKKRASELFDVLLS